jgi:hypothetical protein
LEKTSSPAKDDPPPEQDNSAPEVHMDSRAQQETSDTGVLASGTGTAEDTGAGDMSTDIDNKGKGPAVPEVRTILAPASAGQAAPAAPEQPVPKTPTDEKTSAPAKTAAPAKTSVPAKPSVPAKSGTVKMKQITKTGTQSAATASAKHVPSSSALALQFGKAAARPSFFDTPELEGRVSLLTKSDKSLASLKEYCVKWNDADSMDTASSKKKKLAEAVATGNPADILVAKPIPIASELLNIQQLYLLADATNVSVLLIHIPSPRKCRLSGIRTSGIFQYLLHLAVFKLTVRHISSIRASNPSHRGPG